MIQADSGRLQWARESVDREEASQVGRSGRIRAEDRPMAVRRDSTTVRRTIVVIFSVFQPINQYLLSP